MGKPKIRFEGYSEDWEQRKLSELLYLSSERNDGSYTRDDVLAASLGTELQKKHIYFGLRATDESVKNYKVVLPNDVIYTKSPIKGFSNGIIRTSKGENGIVPTLYCVYHSIDVINPSIIQAYFESKERLDAYLIPLVNIGARNNVNITDKEFLEGAICIPKDKAEQDKIVDVLERLFNLITLHQRKCDEIKTLKKYMLQKMFPQNGEKVPEIRFDGFTEDWEQRKLGELGSLKNGMNFSKEAMGIGFPFVNLQNIFGNNVIDVTNLGKAMASDSQLKDYNLLNGDVLFVRSSVKLEGVGEAALVPQNLENTTYSGFIIRFRDEYGLDNNFKRFIFGIESVRNQIMAQATNSANKNISQTVLENLCLKIPNKSEQEKIGLYFSNLDKLITLHQRKCNELKEIKKYMLQNMFV